MLLHYFSNFISGFVITIVIEIIVASLLGFKKGKEIKVVFIASLITYPILNLIMMLGYSFAGFYSNLSLAVLILELLVVAAEFYILYYVFHSKYSWKYLLVISFLMNAASYGIGLLVF